MFFLFLILIFLMLFFVYKWIAILCSLFMDLLLVIYFTCNFTYNFSKSVSGSMIGLFLIQLFFAMVAISIYGVIYIFMLNSNVKIIKLLTIIFTVFISYVGFFAALGLIVELFMEFSGNKGVYYIPILKWDIANVIIQNVFCFIVGCFIAKNRIDILTAKITNRDSVS